MQVSRARALVSSGAARSVRLGARLSLWELAGQIGCAPSTVLRWERGDRIPRGGLAVRYVEALDTLMKAAQ